MTSKFFILIFLFLFSVTAFGTVELKKIKICTLIGNVLGEIEVKTTDKISDIIQKIREQFNVTISHLIIMKYQQDVPGRSGEFAKYNDSETFGEIIDKNNIDHDTISVIV